MGHFKTISIPERELSKEDLKNFIMNDNTGIRQLKSLVARKIVTINELVELPFQLISLLENNIQEAINKPEGFNEKKFKFDIETLIITSNLDSKKKKVVTKVVNAILEVKKDLLNEYDKSIEQTEDRPKAYEVAMLVNYLLNKAQIDTSDINKTELCLFIQQKVGKTKNSPMYKNGFTQVKKLSEDQKLKSLSKLEKLFKDLNEDLRSVIQIDIESIKKKKKNRIPD